MKNLISVSPVFIFLVLSTSVLFSQSITIETYNKQEPPRGEYDSRVAVKSFEVTNGADPVVYFMYVIGANGAWGDSHPLNLIVTKDDGTEAYNYPFDPGSVSDNFFVSQSFPEGKYTAKIVEGGNEATVWCQKVFSVAPAMTKIPGSKNVIACDHVDDNWNPIDPVTKWSAGQCMNFFVELPEVENDLPKIAWEIFKVKSDGTEKFVQELMMATGYSGKVKHFATSEKLCYFNDKGKYRIYAINWYDNGTSNTEGNYKKYYAKGDFTVE